MSEMEDKMIYSSLTIADWFREKSNNTLTPLQLIKLTYIAHGWCLALHEAPLIDQDVQAWQYGPVIPDLYHQIKHFRGNSVSEQISATAKPIESETKSLLESVFAAYGHLTGEKLSALTHAKGTPWSDVWDRMGRNAVISDMLIKTHYDKLNSERRAA
jgi:uncharacterized phage-associated protein